MNLSIAGEKPAPHVLVVEDDEQIRSFIRDYLEANQFRVSVAESARLADETIKADTVDLVILDRMLPDRSDLDFCRQLYAHDLPIIILTALSQESERIAGLEAGADDYLGKPFSPKELLARIYAVLRRHRHGLPLNRSVQGYRFNGWYLDLSTRKLFDPSGARVYLRAAEIALLHVFCEHAGKVLSRDEIIRRTHSAETANLERSVDLIVSRLRRRIEDDPKDPSLLLTQRSAGYVFTPEVFAQ